MPEPSEASTSRASSGAVRQHVDSKNEQGGKRRKAGGTGKKGKKFMEDKAGLMDLISSVTSSHSAKVDAKLDKSRARLVPPSKDNSDGVTGGTRADLGEEKKKEKERRRAEKGLALARAKDAIREKEREKRRLKKGDNVGLALGPTKPKKRVGFA